MRCGKLYTPMRNSLHTLLIVAIAFGFIPEAFALTVSPAKIEIAADPGQTVSGEIELFNEQIDAKEFFTSTENFESRGDSGAPYFIGANGGLATWISINDKVGINSGARVVVPYTISVPSNTKPGGYFAAIFFGTQQPKGTGGGEVTIGGKIGVLVLLRVNGDVSESAGLVDFGGKEGQRFFSTTPVNFEYGFNNAGGDRTVPRGEIVVRNTFRLKSATLLANEREGSVLPSSTRRFEITWGNKPVEGVEISDGFFATAGRQLKDFHFGWYTAKLNLSWGASAQTATNSYHFFIIPWQLLLLLVIIFGGLGFVIKFGLNRFKRHIIAQATAQVNVLQK